MHIQTSIKLAVVLSALTVVYATAGCSSNKGAEQSPVRFACPSYDPTGDSACKSCIQSTPSCESQAEDAFGTDWATNLAGICQAAVDCLVNCSCGDESCVQNCLAQGGTTCLDADHALYTCLSQSCASPCGASPVSNDAGADSGAPSMDSGSPETGAATDAGPGGDGATATELDASTVPVACNQLPVDHYCIIYFVAAASVSSAQSMCTAQGGIVDTSCPTANLVGCCTIATTKECYYPPTYNVSNASGGCTLAGGDWSTTE